MAVCCWANFVLAPALYSAVSQCMTCLCFCTCCTGPYVEEEEDGSQGWVASCVTVTVATTKSRRAKSHEHQE